MVVMEVCLASRFSLYLCVAVYTKCLYTHDLAFMHNLCLGKEILISQLPSYFDAYFGNAPLLSFY